PAGSILTATTVIYTSNIVGSFCCLYETDLYAPRGAAYFARLAPPRAPGRAPVAVDWFAKDDAWARDHRSYPTAPTGDFLALAEEVRTVLAKAPEA
ncbi:hypothetical protein ACFUJ0_35715, partial [Streptomyces sp. NPDC057242]|uniref:hypothetical protein n=1 Tax=Streptomyces sp. NPDC057242 TaxID=3346063 RepID=UPI00363270BD